MALQSINGGLWLPSPFIGSVPILNANTFLISASGQMAALIFQAPRTGNLDRFDFQCAVANSPDNGLRASFQSVSTTTGLPSGTLLGATNNAFVTYSHVVAAGWKSTNFGEVAAVTRGQLVAAVVDIPSFTASDSVTVFRTAGLARQEGFPYGISGASTKEVSYLPNIAVHYTDGYVSLGPQTNLGADTTAVISYNQGSATADEWGMAFTVPFPCKLNLIHVNMIAAAGADFNVVVYAADGTTVLATSPQDGDVTAGTSETQYTCFLQNELTLAANTLYRVTIQPSTANNVQLRYWTFQSLALMNTLEGGSNLYMTSQLNTGGSWTDYNSGTFRRPAMALQLSALDDGAGGGGGLLVNPGMRGGMI